MELWDLYDKDKIKTGKTMLRGDKIPDGYYHLVVHACIFNSSGELLIQQRQSFKEGWSNMWDITVGGSSVKGENSSEAVRRELFEELGLNICLNNIRPTISINFDGGFDDVYLLEKDVELESLELQYDEVQAVKWANLGEILEMIDSREFIPYHKSFISLIFDMRGKYGAINKANT